jgi:hypothetical protein
MEIMVAVHPLDTFSYHPLGILQTNRNRRTDADTVVY